MRPCQSLQGNVGRALAVTAMIAIALGVSPAVAQDAPLIDAVGAYNHANVMNRPRTDDGKPAAKGETQGKKPANAGATISKVRFDAIVADLRSQYRHRVDRDGKPDADLWLKREVAALRQRYTTIED